MNDGVTMNVRMTLLIVGAMICQPHLKGQIVWESIRLSSDHDAQQSENSPRSETIHERISETIQSEPLRPIPDSARLLSVVWTGPNSLVAGGEYGVVWLSSDAGASWTQISSGTTRPLRRIRFQNPVSGVAVGDSGTVLTTNNGGMSWQVQTTGLGGDLYGASMVDEQRILAVGRRGSIVRSTDAGKTWEALSSGAFFSLRSVATLGSSTAVVVGVEGTILRSADGGDTWRHSFSGTMNDLTDVSFVNSDLGVAVGNGGTIVRSTDGGTSWTPIQSPSSADLASVKCVDADVAVAVSTNGSIVRSTDAGLTWVEVRDSSSVPLAGISFLNATNGVAVGDKGLVLRTDDAGVHWSAQTAKAVSVARQSKPDKVETVVRKKDAVPEKERQKLEDQFPRQLSRTESKETPLPDLRMRLGAELPAKWRPFHVPTMLLQIPAEFAGGAALGFAGVLLGQAIDGKNSAVATILLGTSGAFLGVPGGVCLAGSWMGGNGTFGSTLTNGYLFALGGLALTFVVPPLGVIAMILSPVIGYHVSASPVYETEFPTSLGMNPIDGLRIPTPGPSPEVTVNIVSLTF